MGEPWHASLHPHPAPCRIMHYLDSLFQRVVRGKQDVCVGVRAWVPAGFPLPFLPSGSTRVFL